SRGRVGEGLRILLPDGSCHPIRVARPTELLAAGSAGAVEHALTEDGRWIVFARPDRRRGHPVEETGLVGPLSLETYELQSGRRVARFLLPGESILDPLGEPGGALRAIGGVVRFRGGALLDPLTGLERVPLEWLGPHRRVREGVWIFAGADGRVREVDLRSGEAIRTVEAGIERSEELRFVDAHRAVLATRSRIRLLDLDRGAILWSVSLPSCRGH
ncbi:MAG: hypothetical protein OEY14_10870, partial [Myxococcales bacterium]|nr:hypothetical protein [Myxococcales bacterium]